VTDLIGQAIPEFVRLVENPPSGPVAFDYDTVGDPDSGLIIRTGESKEAGGTYDRKVFWHYRPHLEDMLELRNPEFLESEAKLIGLSREIRARLFEATKCFASELGPHLSIDLVNLLDPDKAVLRFLAYTHIRDDSLAVGDRIIGAAHTDRDALTLALHESHPGLEFERLAGAWREMNSRPDQPIIFAGQMLERATMTSNVPQVRAVWHRVRQLDPTARMNEKIIRLSVVYFTHLRGY
jgi:hypothetical protein